MDGSHLLCLVAGNTFGMVVMGLLARAKLTRWQQKAQRYALRMRP